jgi:hypothetical protein
MKRGSVTKISQKEEIFSSLSPNDTVEIDDSKSWPKPVVCIKSFPRSGTTYLNQNLVLNNFIVIKKAWDVEHNYNQPKPVTILRNLKDCVISNVAMFNSKSTEKNEIIGDIIVQINKYDLFLDSLSLDIDNRTTYTFSQLENKPQKVLESINSIYSLGLVENFVFANKIPTKKYVFNYRSEKVDLFLPSSKTAKKYNDILNIYEEMVDLSDINDKYEALAETIIKKQKSLGIQI